MASNALTLELQRMLQQLTGGNAKDENGVGPSPADSGPALHQAYATGVFDFTSAGPPCKAFFKSLPLAMQAKKLRCELHLQFRVPEAHPEYYRMLGELFQEFHQLAWLYFVSRGNDRPEGMIYRKHYTSGDVNALMDARGQHIRAIAAPP